MFPSPRLLTFLKFVAKTLNFILFLFLYDILFRIYCHGDELSYENYKTGWVGNIQLGVSDTQKTNSSLLQRTNCNISWN